MLNRSRRRNRTDPAELNVTAFLNLMVVLVPILLLSAVFSRMTILELNIPPANPDDNKPQKKEINFVITIRKDALDIGDTNAGLIRRLDNTSGEYNLKGLSVLLRKIKERFPKKQNITLLAEADISYQTLVQVMDTVRVVDQKQDGAMVRVELFPDISLGDAPPLAIIEPSIIRAK